MQQLPRMLGRVRTTGAPRKLEVPFERAVRGQRSRTHAAAFTLPPRDGPDFRHASAELVRDFVEAVDKMASVAALPPHCPVGDVVGGDGPEQRGRWVKGGRRSL